MTDRLMLFVDYQNVYRGARDCFHPETGVPNVAGQITPVLIGEHIVERDAFARELSGVRIYRGLPDATRDSRGNAACTRQIEDWSADPRVAVITRPLRYPRGWPDRAQPGEKPQEKGVDVALAVDFVRLALEDQYDVGVLMSTDTDLKPALETVAKFTDKRVEVAAWSGHRRHSKRLSIDDVRLWCHWLDQKNYDEVCDTTDYSRP
ncbi:NYN domain-containing protein [Phytohabitans sp. ZYX-F-186]|uniref:NYN domain-containing protein n=1 Tax=Phytohabitans maris TaxID=3071409 RepID=A0ABU0Z828_9ACTN|nr:NYN domain-containing protein [Phytohabitans sp. ZYX-F-186]MDQ7903158.1 NYN domain-containing protein [Phytohabitans sp. ZYX-F-186]